MRKSTPDVLGETSLDGGDIVAIALGSNTVELLYDGYDALPEDDRAAVIDRTAAIKARKRASEEGFLHIGKALGEVKARLPYGQFGRWLEQEFAWSPDTAWRLMRIYESFGSTQIPRIAESGASVLAMLAAPSVPEAARDEFKARAAAGPVPVKEAKAIVAKHKKPAPAPKAGVSARSEAPVWKPQPQPEPEPETATPLQQALLDWARTLPAGQRIFSLKDLATHRARSMMLPKAQRFSPLIGRASVSQIAEAAHWARLQLLDDNSRAVPEAVVIEAEPVVIAASAQPSDLTPSEVCAALRVALDLPRASHQELLSAFLEGPRRRLSAGPGKLIVWRTEDGRRVLRLNDGTVNPPWLELNDSQAAWLVKELSDAGQ